MRGTSGTGDGNSEILTEGMESPDSEDAVSARESLSSGERSPYNEYSDNPADVLFDRVAISRRITEPNYVSDYESSDSDSSSDPEASLTLPSMESMEENTTEMPSREDSSPSTEVQSQLRNSEDFATWQRIIRLDAIRSNGEWMTYSATQGAPVTDDRARRCAEAVGLKDYDHLDPSRIFHAARLVAILEAYALYDPEIGYCQGMSDLLSPIISVITEDFEAFWCFVGFMKKARHNFRLDEVGIRRQLNIVSKIIKYKDSHLYRHLEKLQAEDCFFVYRMVIVLFRRELTFDQTLCLWEVMWADQAAIRAGIGKSAWSRIRLRAPPTEDLLLYAIAASVLQRRKQIIEKYSSMDEILRECNNMAGHLDVWKLLDDAHDLVVTLHDKI
nr:GTPase-activating protein gyp7-like isoform X2 [Ipomoea batatas]